MEINYSTDEHRRMHRCLMRQVCAALVKEHAPQKRVDFIGRQALDTLASIAEAKTAYLANRFFLEIEILRCFKIFKSCV